MKRLLPLFLCLLILLTGCGKKPSLIRYDISSSPRNLDPQFATREVDQMVIHNIFEGLVRQLPSGAIEEAAAQSCTISPDGKTYTFTLREDLQWKGGDDPVPVTAQDFVFAFRRIFNMLSPSPYAQMFLSIDNAQHILDGDMGENHLGVSAPDDRTVVFTLTKPDASFLERLAHSAAMPCNQQIFEETKGKYGTTKNATASNGPFFLNLWDESKLYLKKNPRYHEAESIQSPGVYLYIGRDRPQEEGDVPPTLLELVMNGKSDSCFVTVEQAREASQKGFSYEEQSATVWGLTVNPHHRQLSNELIRKAFFHSIQREELEGYLGDNMVLTDRIIAPAISLFTQPYVTSAPVPSKTPDPALARQECEEGLLQIEAASLDPMELLVPEDSNVPFLAGMLQQMWQRNLSAFVNIVSLPRDELQQRVADGQYDLAIVPFTASTNTPYDVLSRFLSNSPENIWGYRNTFYDSLLHQAAASSDPPESRSLYAQSEASLYEDCIVFPMFHEISCILFAPDVTGIQVYPYGGMVSFRDAVAVR